MKNPWAVFAVLPPAVVLVVATFVIGAHLAASDTPAPAPGVYIAALTSLVAIAAIFLTADRTRARRLEEQTIQVARHQIDSPEEAQ